MRFDVITLFPNMFDGPLSESIISRAKENGKVEINLHNLRDFALDKHKTVDDTPYGGGPGMVIKPDVMDRALENIKSLNKGNLNNSRIILLTPKGKKLTQKKVLELSELENIVLVAGHYEGFDQRIHDHMVDEELSVGDYILTGGELPAMVVIDTVTRMLPGVIKKESRESESFMSGNKKDYPVYTRPEEYKGHKVPEVLKSGDHQKIKEWREKRKGADG